MENVGIEWQMTVVEREREREKLKEIHKFKLGFN